MTPILDRYPEIERPLRGDGSPEARRKCLEPVLKNLPKITALIQEMAKLKNLKIVNIMLFQSRATGTCKPTSDADFYIQLSEDYTQLVLDHGVLYKDTGNIVICGEWKDRFLSEPDPTIIERMGALRFDVYLGVDEEPPAKVEYKGTKYYITLEELKARST